MSRVQFDARNPAVVQYIAHPGAPAQTLHRCGQHYHLPVEHVQRPGEVTPRDRHLVAGATPPLAALGAIVEIHTVFAAEVVSPCQDPESIDCCRGQALVLAYSARVVSGGSGPIPARPPGSHELAEYSGSTTGADRPEEHGCKPPAQWSFARGDHFTVGQEQLRHSFPRQGAQEARPLQSGERLSGDLTIVR